MSFFVRSTVASIALFVAASGAHAASPRETLIRAAFATHDKAQALTLVNEAIGEAEAMLAHDPGNYEARFQQALGIGYRGQLTHSPTDAKTAHADLEALAAADPRNAETQLALAGWHLTAVNDLGSFLARTMLGASRDKGFADLNRSVAMGGNRAFFAGYSALIHIKLDKSDVATSLQLALRAANLPAPTPLDRVVQHAAMRMIPALQAGDGTTAAAIAKETLPFGMVD